MILSTFGQLAVPQAIAATACICCVFVYLCVHVHAPACEYMCVYVCASACVRARVCMCVCLYVRVCICVCVSQMDRKSTLYGLNVLLI